MGSITFPDWLNLDLLAVLGATVAASIALVGLVGLRKLPIRVKIGAILIRCAILVCAILMLSATTYSTTALGPGGVVILDESTPSAVASAARDRAKTHSARLLEVSSEGVTEDGIRIAETVNEALMRLAATSGTGTEHPPVFIDAWLKAEDVNLALPMLTAIGAPHAVRALYPASAGDSPGRSPVPKTDDMVMPSVQLHGAPVVLAREPGKFGVTIRGLPSGSTVLVSLDGKPLELEQVGADEYETKPTTLEPGAHELHAKAMLGGEPVAEFQRSVAAVEGEEVLVLSRRRATVDAIHALLPGFKVVGLDPDGTVEPEYMSRARAVLLPLEEHPEPTDGLMAMLTTYAEAGGMLLVTGMTEARARVAPVGGRVASLLPVRLLPPPELPPAPPPEDQPEEKPAETPKPVPSPPNVKTEKGEAEVAKVSVAFVIDHSTSMSEGGRWSHAVAAVRSALENIQSYDRIGVLLFADAPKWAIGGGMVDVGPAMAATIREYLADPANGPQAAATTDIYAAVDAALVAMSGETSAARLIVVISDGDEGPARRVDEDHLALAARAMAQSTMIATIRVGTVGPADWIRRADRVMTALATRENLRASVSDDEGAVKIPSLSLAYVQLAYRRHSEIEAERKKQREDQEAEERRKAEEELRRREEEERRRLEALTEEERRREQERIQKQNEERRRKEEEEAKRLLPGGFRQGILPVTSTVTAMDALRWPLDLPPIGEGLLAADSLPGAVMLAVTQSDNRPSPAIAAIQRGFGSVLWFRAPLDATNAGSWLSNSSHAGGLLDPMIRRYGRPRLSELSPLSLFETHAGRAVAQVSGGRLDVEFVAVTHGGREISLTAEHKGEQLTAVVPPVARLVELRAKDGSVLARASAVRVAIRQEQATPSAAMPVTKASEVTYVRPETLTRHHPDRWWTMLLLVLALGLLPIERWLRRT